MSSTPSDDVIAANGPRGVLVFARRADGTMEAKEWLDSHPDVMASFGQLFERLVNQGALFPNKEQFKKMKGISGGSVWEFKRGGDAGHRFFLRRADGGNTMAVDASLSKGQLKRGPDEIGKTGVEDRRGTHGAKTTSAHEEKR